MCLVGCIFNQRWEKVKELIEREINANKLVPSDDLERQFTPVMGYLVRVILKSKWWINNYPCLKLCETMMQKWYNKSSRYWLLFGGEDSETQNYDKISPAEMLQFMQELIQTISSAEIVCTNNANADDKNRLKQRIETLKLLFTTTT